MSSVSSELMALGSTSVDFYLRIRQALGRETGPPRSELRISQLATIAWASSSSALRARRRCSTT
jgi:hypothetical protein